MGYRYGAATLVPLDLSRLVARTLGSPNSTVLRTGTDFRGSSINQARNDGNCKQRLAMVRHALAKCGTALPDLLVAATAEAGEVTLLHYDADFERIAVVSSQAQEWAVPRGSV